MENKNSFKQIFKNNKSNNSNSLKVNVTNSSKPVVSKYKMILITIIVIILICIFIYLIICVVHYYSETCHEKKDFFKYLFDYSNNDVCTKKEAPVVKTNPIENIIKKLENKKEVFHIANQDYTYDQSKCKCESYGARLATKNEVIDAYNKGAHWCSYGWSEGQVAYYPVQKCTWDELKDKNDRLPVNNKIFCGVPGINGGYFANPNLKFGINCYGVKPKGSISKPKKATCPEMNFCKLENNYQASHKLDTDEIVGFNNDDWSSN